MPSRRTAWSVPTEQSIRDLASFDAGDARVLSFFLDVDGRRFPRRQDYEKIAADLLKELEPSALPRVARFSLEADVRRVHDYITKEFDRGPVRGLAIFACAASRKWDVFRLPMSLRSRAVVDTHPHVLRLEALLDRAERFATVIVGRERARIFTSRLGDIEQHADIRDEVPGRHDQGGWSQANYGRHIEELATRHYRNVAENLFALSQRLPVDHIILASPDEVAASFEKVLRPSLAERVAARIHLPAGATKERVRTETLAVWDALESERAADIVAKILEEYAGGRMAVVGLRRTLAALQQSRVDVLALSDGNGVTRPGWRCTGCRELSLENEKCPSCGAALAQVTDLGEEMVDEALRRRCRVVAAETQRLPEGVGALLRF